MVWAEIWVVAMIRKKSSKIFIKEVF